MNALSSPNSSPTSVDLDNHVSIQAAADYSDYNLQYLRRLVRHRESFQWWFTQLEQGHT
jgi:hypothetical protein